MTPNPLFVICALFLGVLVPSHGHQESPSAVRQKGVEDGRELVRGRVTQIHAPRLFTVHDEIGSGREVLVLVPRSQSTPWVGASVEVRGAFRRFTEADLGGTTAWDEVDERTRRAFAGRRVLVAASFIATMAGQPVPPMRGVPPPETPKPPPAPAPALPLRVRPVTLVNYIDELAGQRVRILNARVVGVFDPQAFLIESATRYEMLLGRRDRVLVLIGGGKLRMPAESLVSASVTVLGIARSLLGAQVSGEVPWPARLTPELVKRLEVRAAVLASSVQTAEGIELTDRASPSGQ